MDSVSIDGNGIWLVCFIFVPAIAKFMENMSENYQFWIYNTTHCIILHNCSPFLLTMQTILTLQIKGGGWTFDFLFVLPVDSISFRLLVEYFLLSLTMTTGSVTMSLTIHSTRTANRKNRCMFPQFGRRSTRNCLI